MTVYKSRPDSLLLKASPDTLAERASQFREVFDESIIAAVVDVHSERVRALYDAAVKAGAIRLGDLVTLVNTEASPAEQQFRFGDLLFVKELDVDLMSWTDEVENQRLQTGTFDCVIGEAENLAFQALSKYASLSLSE